MKKTIVKVRGFDFSFTDADVVDLDTVRCFEGEYNPHGQRLWLLHDHGFTICVVQGDSLQNALDAAVDADKLDRYLVTIEQADDYGGDIYDCESLAYLGNACEPFDIESLGYVELPNPKFSLTALYGETIEADNAHFGA